MNELINQKIDKDFFFSFREWVNFNMESLTWQGRYAGEFEEFWLTFFSDDLTVRETIARFDYSCKIVKIGPLVSWFTWLKKKFLAFVFIKKNHTILELSEITNIPLTDLSYILREFFVEKFPYSEEYFSDKFQISSMISPNINLTFSKIKTDIEIEDFDFGSTEDDVLPSMEVTLYEEWIDLLSKIKKDFKGKEQLSDNISFRENFKKAFKIVRDVVLLIACTAALIWIIQNVNKYYENYLLDKISIYEPQLDWLNKNLTFKRLATSDKVDSGLVYDIEEAKPEKLSEKEEAEMVEEIFKPESEVMVTSWDSLPRDINVANLEQSDYEERERRGYREYRYGRNKVFRVLLKTSDFIKSRKDLNVLSQKYSVEQVDNVKPGTLVPGGAYYNLYVPRKYLKEFLAQVMEQNEGVLYESRTRSRRNPPNKNKVFIWVKQI